MPLRKLFSSTGERVATARGACEEREVAYEKCANEATNEQLRLEVERLDVEAIRDSD